MRRVVAATVLVMTLCAVLPAGPGSAAGDPAVYQGQATRLYVAYFLRPPDVGGLRFWIGRLDGGMSLFAVSQFFSQSQEFRDRYGTLSDPEFVDLVYRNVLGRPPEPNGRAFWAGELSSGRRTRGSVMVGFSESPEFVAKTGTTPPTVPPDGCYIYIPPVSYDLIWRSPCVARADDAPLPSGRLPGQRAHCMTFSGLPAAASDLLCSSWMWVDPPPESMMLEVP